MNEVSGKDSSSYAGYHKVVLESLMLFPLFSNSRIKGEVGWWGKGVNSDLFRLNPRTKHAIGWAWSVPFCSVLNAQNRQETVKQMRLNNEHFEPEIDLLLWWIRESNDWLIITKTEVKCEWIVSILRRLLFWKNDKLWITLKCKWYIKKPAQKVTSWGVLVSFSRPAHDKI